MALYKVPALDDARTLDRRLSVVHCRAGRHGVRLHATHCAALARPDSRPHLHRYNEVDPSSRVNLYGRDARKGMGKMEGMEKSIAFKSEAAQQDVDM